MDTNFKNLLVAEVTKAHEDLAHNGDINTIALSNEDYAINAEWHDVLDKAFDLIADFAKKYKIEGCY